MKFKRWIAMLMAVVMMVSVVSPTAFAEGWGQNGAPIVVNGDAGDGDGGTGEPSECTCTALCTETNKDTNCSLCMADYTQCKVEQSQPAEELALAVGWKPEKAYAAYGDSVNITVSGSLSGTGAESVTVAITLSDAEAALLTIPDDSKDAFTISEAADGKKTLSFTVTAGTEFKQMLTASAPNATQLTTLDVVASSDVTATATSEAEGQTVQVNFNNGATAASTLTFVKTLPDENTPYGSVTESEGSVASLTVTYVDKDGQPIARQETAPTFTLYYQVAGADAEELKEEESLPFGLTQLPKITAASADTTWTGSVAKDTALPLPSKVLALEGNTVVEKTISWFLKPSYPEGYYPNAGALVQITEESASQYPSGLKNGQWYFIAGETPYEDDDITITEKTSLSHNIYWADNGNAENKRPTSANVSTLYKLQFSFDGSSEYTTLTEESMKTLGLETMPEPALEELSGIWSLHWNNTLPSQVTYSDSTGGGEPITRNVTWRYVPKDAVKSYAMVEVTEENADDYSSVQDRYGTYYVLETDLTFTARIYRGENTKPSLSDAFYEQFYLDAEYTGNNHQYFQMQYIKDDNHIQSVPSEDPNIITVTITHLWRYNLDNTRINYSLKEGIVETPGSNTVTEGDGKLDNITGLDDPDDYFAISYDNSAVPSFSGVTDGVYSGGTLKLTLTGTRNFNATKVWLDDNSTERPTAEMELWRYREGEGYSTAALVRDKDGKPYTVTLEKDQTEIHFGDEENPLPKYDAEGYKYLYVVREYLEGDHASKYEQVFGVVGTDGNVSGDIVEGSETNKRAENNTWLYDGGTLSNRLKGTIPVSVTKDWKAASFQSEFGDVMVELRLQSRPANSDNEKDWENTEYTYEMTDFYAENLTVTHTGAYPRYDEHGQELEYRWVEEAVYQGGTVGADGKYSGGTPVESNTDADGDTRTFTLKQNDRDIVYKSTVDATGTKITNSIANTINYEVTKTFEGGWNAEKYQTSYTFALYRSTSGSGLEKYATFTMTQDGTKLEVTKEQGIDDAELSITSQGDWIVKISGLPEFDADGQQYEYLLMEVDGNLVDSTTTRDHDGNYQSIITNGPGSTNIILVRKAWVDESDIQHRLPVTITVYEKATNAEVASTTLGNNGNWYDLVNIGEKNADQVYILETEVGDTKINNTQAPPIYTNEAQGEQTPTAVQFKTQYHNYEATYAKEDYTVDEGSSKTIPMFTVTNRRLGNINLTVTKNWVDGDGTARSTLQEKLEAAGLNLAVKLDFLNGNNNGDYTISYTGYGNDGAGDTVTISEGNNTPIQDAQNQPVDAIQNLDTTQSKQTIYFWNLPKYDTNGASVRYTVKEIFVDADGTEVSESKLSADGASSEYKAVAEAYRDYSSSLTAGPYTVGENHALDRQAFTLSNKLSATKDVSWYAL